MKPKLNVMIKCCIFTMYNAPNGFKERGEFFVDFNEYLHDNIVGKDYFIVGDFNCVNDGKDKSNDLFPDSSVRFYNDLISNNSLKDIWRVLHPHNSVVLSGMT